MPAWASSKFKAASARLVPAVPGGGGVWRPTDGSGDINCPLADRSGMSGMSSGRLAPAGRISGIMSGMSSSFLAGRMASSSFCRTERGGFNSLRSKHHPGVSDQQTAVSISTRHESPRLRCRRLSASTCLLLFCGPAAQSSSGSDHELRLSISAGAPAAAPAPLAVERKRESVCEGWGECVC